MAETSSPAAAAAQTDAEREEALDRMLTRLALAEDARLAPLLARVLPYAITSLASPAASVRKLLVSSRYVNRLLWLRTLLGHVNADAREATSRLLGITSSALSSTAALDLLSELTSTFDQNRPSRFENYHGFLCAIGYITAGCLKESYITEEIVQKSIDILVKVVKSEGSALASTAMEALGHIGLRCLLPSINRNSSQAALLTILNEKLAKLLSENDTKAIQKILISLGHLSWNELSFAHLNNALDLIFSLSRSKVEDVLFAAGEALSFIWGEVPVTTDVILETNFVSLSQATNYLTGDAPLLVSSNSSKGSDCEEAHAMAREEIIKRRKEERCAGTVWLVSLTMYCGQHPKILELLPQIQMNAGNAGIQTEKLESLRIAVAKDSPMWETLDICLKVVDKESLDLLVPRLAQMVKSAVGLNTRVGVASFITLLVQKVMVEIKSYAATLLRLLYSAVLEEKSSAAKRAFASSCAAVLKYASPSQAQKLIEDTTSLHLGEKNAQLSAAILIKSYLSNATDILSGYNAVVLPVIFASRFDDDKDIGALYGELWEDIPSSERVTLQLYLPEIISLLCDSMSSSSWAGKRKSAKAIKKLCDALGESLSVHHNNILESLLKELPGRFWEGKDAILDALAALCSSCHTAMSAEDSGMPSVILNAVCAACSRKSKLYREAAFSCLQQVITAFKDPGFFNIVFPMLYEVSNRSVICKTRNSSSLTSSSSAEQDENEGVSVSLDKVLNCVASSITVAFPQDIINQRKNILEIILNSLSPEEGWQIKLSSFLCIKELCYKFQNSDGNNTWPEETTNLVEELFHSSAPKVVDVIRLVKIAQVHTAASECLLELSKLYRGFPLVDRKGAKFSGELAELCESEKSEQAKAFLKQCMDILKDFEDATGLAMEMD
uniref:Proteasome adapter and scaffold protein ECM29 HEAT-repeat domain-containing protein n=1 Tax=Oryza glumipatula TaxID=40148 RepID=A0A0E0BF13_9ORYZ